MSLDNINILISAVGGQGAILASKILGKLAINLNYDVKVSEIHGMSQRGGSVVTFVRFGKKVYSPVVEKGTADYIISFEKIEGVRYIEWLKNGGIFITNTQEINPMPVITGKALYPHNILENIKEIGKNFNIKTIEIDALKIAKEINNIRGINVILLGAFASLLDIPLEQWEKSIRDSVPAKTIELNLKSFLNGYNSIKNYKDYTINYK